MAYQHRFTDNGNSDEFSVLDEFNVIMDGDFGGGTCAIQIETAGGWVLLSDTAKTSGNAEKVWMTGNNKYRINMAGASNPDLNVSITGDVG